MTLAEKSLEIAISQLGVEEIPRGSNGGPQVSAYLKRVNLAPGNAWCMAFVYWCVDEACKQLGMENPLVRTGHVLHQYNNTSCRTLPKTSRAIKPGDIFIMKIGSKGAGHTGFVKAMGGTVAGTVEGNTDDQGGREGFEVAQKLRPPSSFHGIIQLP